MATCTACTYPRTTKGSASVGCDACRDFHFLSNIVGNEESDKGRFVTCFPDEDTDTTIASTPEPYPAWSVVCSPSVCNLTMVPDCTRLTHHASTFQLRVPCGSPVPTLRRHHH